MKDALLIELAETWELQAETGGDGVNKFEPAARETLRMCADALRMLADFSQRAKPHEPSIAAYWQQRTLEAEAALASRQSAVQAAPSAPLVSVGAWVRSLERMPPPGTLIVKRWDHNRAVWAGLYHGSTKEGSFDEWIALEHEGATASPAGSPLTNEQIAQIYLGSDYVPGAEIPVWAYAFARKIIAASTTAPTEGPAPLTVDELRGLDTPTRVRFYEHDFYRCRTSARSTFGGARAVSPRASTPTTGRSSAVTTLKPMTSRSCFERHRRMRRSSSPRRMKARRRADWDDVKVDIMRDILRAKAAQHEYVRRKLLATGDRELVEDSWRDDFWGWGPNRDGKNMLGRLWMEVRAELRALREREGAQASALPQQPQEEPAHLIFYDDTEVKPEIFAGRGATAAAHHRFKLISARWNAHLFVKIKSNSRDDPFANANAVLADTPPAQRQLSAPLTDQEIDEIADDGCRNAAGGIYATRVYEFARAIEAKLSAEMAASPMEQAPAWPKEREVGRVGDMAPAGDTHMRVGLDNDNDVYVAVWDNDGNKGMSASIEFCNGGGGGGGSPRTRMALIELMVAMEADNAERPNKRYGRAIATRSDPEASS
jgi:hypothetical protein